MSSDKKKSYNRRLQLWAKISLYTEFGDGLHFNNTYHKNKIMKKDLKRLIKERKVKLVRKYHLGWYRQVGRTRIVEC